MGSCALVALSLWVGQGAGCASGQVAEQDAGTPGWADDGGGIRADSGGTGSNDGSGSGGGEAGDDGSSGGGPTDSGNCTGGGTACTPSNPCKHGVIDCASGTPSCVSTGNLPDGTSCGASGICESGTCEPCGATGQHCCSGGACSGSPLACIGAIASTCRSNVNPQCTCGTLNQGMQLEVIQSLWSCDGRFQLVLQGDGNLVLYMSGTALWASNTVGSGAAVAVMQDDGNFVIYTSGGKPVWSSATAGSGCGTHLVVQTDGNTVIYNSAGTAIWSTKTCCH